MLMSFGEVLTVFALFLAFCSAKRDAELYCGACHVLVDEIDYAIKQIDPRKTIQVGSFRVDPKGDQKTWEIPYARSEVYLTELVETVCERMNQYAQSTNPQTQKKTYVRTSSRNGETLSLSNISMNQDISKALRFACESIIEDFEDDIVKLFSKEGPKLHELQNSLCLDTAELCTEPAAEKQVTKPGENAETAEAETTEAETIETEGTETESSKPEGSQPEAGEIHEDL
ncbi:protein canopy homolog 2-like [Branchiostoma lanceolatum]|uniref:protein canopy homolog 2-like n=1 Tax=Branchiostoma lanceolatum TaxID=7740 RepID=UPI00345241CB